MEKPRHPADDTELSFAAGGFETMPTFFFQATLSRQINRLLIWVIAGLLLLPMGCQNHGELAADRNPSGPKAAPDSPLWGTLAPGPYRIGFRSLFRYDASRTWRQTRDFGGAFSPDPEGRPVQVNLWYPANPHRSGRPMIYGDYVNQTAPKEFTLLNALMENRNRQNAESSVSPSQLPALLAMPVRPAADATAAAGRFPVAVLISGLNGDINSNFILAEYLASRGWVVASISLLGQSDQQADQTRDPDGLDTVVRDLEFALGLLAHEPNADLTRLATIGHSVGAVEAVMVALRNGNVRATVSLDGTHGFKGSSGVLTNTYGFAPNKLRAALLDLRRAPGEQGAELDLEPVMSFRHAERFLVTLPAMHHSDFTSFAMVAAHFQVPIRPAYAGTAWNRTTGRRGYEAMCRMVAEFLTARLEHKDETEAFSQMVRSVTNATYRHLNAEPPPLSPLEAVALADRDGLDAVKSMLTRIGGGIPVGERIDLSGFNAAGYALLGKKRPKDALVVWELAAWSHPTSANAQDSLADGFLGLADKDRARSAIQRAVELAPADPDLGTGEKAAFISEERHRLEQLAEPRR